MKIKLYHKVLKMAKKEYASDPRPSRKDIEHAWLHYVKPEDKFVNNLNFVLRGTAYRRKSESAAWLAYLVWNWKLEGQDGEEDRYSLAAIVREKYKRFAKKWWSAENVLMRAIKFGEK